MNTLPREQTVTTWARLLRVQTHWLNRVNRALKAAGLPPLSWYDVLLELYRAGEGGLRQYQIGARTLLPKYNLSRLIDRLEREERVQRLSCPEDGRGNVVRITPAGVELLKSMWPVYGAEIHTLLEERLTAVEIATLGALLDKLLAPDGPADAGDSGP